MQIGLPISSTVSSGDTRKHSPFTSWVEETVPWRLIDLIPMVLERYGNSSLPHTSQTSANSGAILMDMTHDRPGIGSMSVLITQEEEKVCQ